MSKRILVVATTIMLMLSIVGMPMKTAKAAVPAPPVPISPVSDFVICSPIPSTVNLSWSSVPGDMYYVVRCSTSPDFGTLLYNTTTPYNSVPYNFDLGMRYYWDVKVVTSGGESDWSSTATFEILPQPPELISPLGLIPPGNVLFVVRTCFWVPIKIRVFCCPYSSYSVFEVTLFPYQAIVIGGNRLEYRFASPYPFAAGNYYWEAEVIVGIVESSWPNGYFQIIYPPSYAPQLISPSNGELISKLNVNLVWNPVPGADKYKVNINDTTVITSDNSYSFIAEDNTDNRWSVTPGNIAGWGPESETRYFKVLLPPSTPFLISPQNGAVIQNTNSILLSCSSVETADYYLVQITDLTLGTFQTFQITAPNTTLNYLGLWGHQYSWWVETINRSGKSHESNTYYFTIQENIPPRIEIDSYRQCTNLDHALISGKADDLESGLDALCLGLQQIPVNADGTFQISLNLNEGHNTFTFTAVDKAGNKTQKTIDILKDTTPPELNITSPVAPIYPASDVFTVISDIKITGTVKDLLLVILRINNRQVLVDSFGNFVFQTTLNFGPNKIYIQAIDAAGNVTEKTLLISKNLPGATIKFQINNPKMKILKINEAGGTFWSEEEIDPGRWTIPKIVNGRIFIPIRKYIEEIGGKIFWDPVNKKVTIYVEQRGKTIELWIGKNEAQITEADGRQYPVEIEKGDDSIVPFIYNGRTCLPLRFISEQLNATVTWDEIPKIATIEFPIVP